jgi:5-formyltetrahydrofolate cyclo-ligase
MAQRRSSGGILTTVSIDAADDLKKRLRREMHARIASLKPEVFHEEGLRAAERLSASPLWTGFGTVLIFLSTEREIDTLPLLEAALGSGKRVFAPCVKSVEHGEMAFYRVFSTEGPWLSGAYGIKEPLSTEKTRLEVVDFPALILTPGLAFDAEGGRLGRGAGFYDRFLSQVHGLPWAACGFCLDCQVVERVPVEKEDQKMDALVHASSLLCMQNSYERPAFFVAKP